jgi:hypothetical protein
MAQEIVVASPQTAEKVRGSRNPEFLANIGKGRKKGVPNKSTTQVKELVLSALEAVGGIEYLKQQAHDNPTSFLTLVGKVIPTQLQHEGNIAQPMNVVFVRMDSNAA